MEEVARVVLALDAPDVTEEVMHFLDRSGAARVVGTAVDGSQLAEAMRQLEPDAVVATPSLAPPRGSLNGSALLAVDTAQSVGSLRRAIRSGATGFYLWPAEREELALAAARAGRAAKDTPAEPAPVIAVYGARGGAGSTFVTTHLAAAFAARGHRCVLVDLDVTFADATAALGVPASEPVRTIAELTPLGDEVDARHVEAIVWRHGAGFGSVLAPGDRQRSARAWAGTYRATISATRRTCDAVLLHLPRGLDEVTLTGLELSDRVLVVLGLDVLSFRDAKRAIDAADLDARCAFVVNGSRRSEISPRDVERVFGRSPIGVVRADRSVGTAQDRGRLLPMRGRTGRTFLRLADRLLEEEA